MTYFAYVEAKLLSDLSVSLSNKLYDACLNKPYSFHLSNNSAKLTRNIDEIALVVGSVKASILLITEVIVFLGIATFLIVYEPTGSMIVIFFLGFFGFVFFRNIQLKIKELGKTRQIHRASYLKLLREGLRSIRDIKILSELIDKKIDLGLCLDKSVLKEFENKTKHYNYLFFNSINFIYEFFKFDSKIENNYSNKIFNLLENNTLFKKYSMNFADKGLI